MSRTDIHRPWLVQLNDPYNRRKIRRFGPGELDYRSELRACGCRMCTGYWEQKWGHETERMVWRVARDQILQLVDKSDVDEPMVRPRRQERYWYISSILKYKVGQNINDSGTGCDD